MMPSEFLAATEFTVSMTFNKNNHVANKKSARVMLVLGVSTSAELYYFIHGISTSCSMFPFLSMTPFSMKLAAVLP
jgi:hypothetical protein